jgi:hypothetical protein
MNMDTKEWYSEQMRRQGEAYKKLFQEQQMTKRTHNDLIHELIDSELGQYSYFNVENIEETDIQDGETFFDVAVSLTNKPERRKVLSLKVTQDKEIHVDMYDHNWEVVEGQWGDLKYLWMALLNWEI